MKKNLDGVFSVDYDFVKVLHHCKSVDHLLSWNLNIYIILKIWCGEEYTHQYISEYITRSQIWNEHNFLQSGGCGACHDSRHETQLCGEC